MNLKRFFMLVITVIGVFTINRLNVFGDETGEYLIKINRVQNCVTVYSQDDRGRYTVPVKSIVCSVGINLDDTPTGSFAISEKQEWGKLVDGSYGQYCSRIIDSIMIHSVPYNSNDKSTLKTEEFNKLGQPASLGCIRMRVTDAKWIFDNCPDGTAVIVYDDDVSPGPLGKPKTAMIPEGHEYGGWDPTDDNESNPWKNLSPVINGAHDIEIEAGDKVDLNENISASDICGNDISELIDIEGEYNQEKAGIYNLEYIVTDGFGYSARESFTLKVNEKPTEPVEQTTSDSNAQAVQVVKEPKTGVGPIMKILFIALCTFIVSTLFIKRRQ
ncbi:MAG: L,D-transpeptidase family protein [Lachnospiraceae bacterium]|nr:L,D-transpeptidase family protein [Lachnospiraceae bacterium]